MDYSLEHPMKAFIFDMDGTVLDTMPDLAIAANEALVRKGFPTRAYDDLLALMGYGGRYLIERAVPESATPEQAEETSYIQRFSG